MAMKKVNAISRGRAAKGAREMAEQKKVRQSSEAQTRFQGEEREKEIRTRPVPVPPSRPAGLKRKSVPVPPARPAGLRRMAKGGMAKKDKK